MNNQESRRGDEPPWKRLFATGDFNWTFQMRRGDAVSFFAPRDEDGGLLAEKNRWLDADPGRYAATIPAGKALVETAWDTALAWGHVRPPESGTGDLVQLGRQWEPDVLLLDRETLTVAAGCVCLPSSWDLRHAVGKSLHEVHGRVPRLNPQIGEKIDRFLKSLAPGKAFRRENWSITRTAERNYHPALNRRPLDETVTIDELVLRIEQQVFTAVGGGILMGIRIEPCPLADLAADPEVWSALAGKIRTMPEDVAVYKGMRSAQEAVVREMIELPGKNK